MSYPASLWCCFFLSFITPQLFASYVLKISKSKKKIIFKNIYIIYISLLIGSQSVGRNYFLTTSNTKPSTNLPSKYLDFTDNISKFDDIPSSCKDLYFLGHTLSGFYLAKGIDAEALKVETIYCEFNGNAQPKSPALYVF